MTQNNKSNLYYNELMPQIGPDSIRSTVDMLRLFASGTGASAAVTARIDELEQRYFFMLRFIASGNAVPDAAAELRSMTETAREICTQIERERVGKEGRTLYGAQMKYEALRPEENLQSLVSDYLSELERLRTDSASLTDSRRNAALERIAADIFMRIWVEYSFAAEDAELLMSLFDDTEIPQYDSELWLGAIGLGLLAYDDRNRRRLLLDIVRRGREALSAIAAVWLVIGVSIYDETPRGQVNPVIVAIDEAHPGDVADIYLELFRACGTKEISDNLARDILPDVMDIGRRMSEKFKGDVSKIEDAMRNGDWDAGIDVNGYDKIKGFMEAQNRGDDVYMATLGKMRHFPFFNSIPNWFLPFHTGRSDLADVTDGEGLAFADSVDRLPFLCDSDKYALLLSVAQTPAPMRDKLLANLAESRQAMDGEMLEAAIEEMKAHGRLAVFSRYIKGLYRFFSLFRRKSEFHDVFDIRLLFRNVPNEMLAVQYHDKMAVIADTLLRLRYYLQAARFFNDLAQADPDNEVYLQKSGYANELADNIMFAISDYEHALSHKEDRWTLCRLANVLTKAEKFAEVIDLLGDKADRFADDAEMLGLLATAAYHTGDYARALELYYNIAYIEGGDAAKPVLAWLLVINKDFDAAEATFADFIENSDKPSDWLHYGHMFWARGEIAPALDAYARAASLVSPQKESFAEIFADSFGPMAGVMTPAQLSALRTVPDIISFRTYGSRFGTL